MSKHPYRGADKAINEAVASVIAEMGVQNRPRHPSNNIAKMLLPAFMALNDSLSQAFAQSGQVNQPEQIVNAAIMQLAKMVPEVGAALKGGEANPMEALQQAAQGKTEQPQQQPGESQPPAPVNGDVQATDDQPIAGTEKVAKPTDIQPQGKTVSQGIPGKSRNPAGLG